MIGQLQPVKDSEVNETATTSEYVLIIVPCAYNTYVICYSTLCL